MTTDFTGGDIGDRSTFSNSANPMTALDPLSIESFLEDVKRVSTSKIAMTMRESLASRYNVLCMANALEAVLAIPESDTPQSEPSQFWLGHAKGYNQRGIDVRSAISQALEGRG